MGEKGRNMSLPEMVEICAQGRLMWFEELGYGFYPVENTPYDQEYFDRYRGQADTKIGLALNRARCDLVRTWWPGPVLDVGIGDGAFLRARGSEQFDQGFDVNPAGIAYLQSRGQFSDLYAEPPHPVATFWDSLEHIESPHRALAQVGYMAFVSLPIFDDVGHVLRSKHFRRDEHWHYFTRTGFIRFAGQCGFAVADQSSMESDIGREGIETFVLTRKE